MSVMSPSKKKVSVDLTEFDVELILMALGTMQQKHWDSGRNSKPLQYLISKIYRAMGVRL